MVVLECLRQVVDACQPLDEWYGHGLCAQIHLEKFLGILCMDIVECGCLYDVANLVALELQIDFNASGMNCNETHDSEAHR